MWALLPCTQRYLMLHAAGHLFAQIHLCFRQHTRLLYLPGMLINIGEEENNKGSIAVSATARFVKN